MNGRFVVVSSIVGAVSLAAGAGADINPVSPNANVSNGIVTPLSGLRSFRWDPPQSSAISSGDTYGAALLGQSSAGAAFLTNTGRTTSFVYDLAASIHGTMAVSGATVTIGESQTTTGPFSQRIVIDMLTTDSSPLWLSGLTIGGQPMTQGRFDVGAGAFTDGLLWDNTPAPILSLVITNALFIDSTLIATSGALANGRTLPEMGSVVVWNGVVGSQVDESQMIFDVTYVPAPGSVGMLAAVGLMALRRRR